MNVISEIKVKVRKRHLCHTCLRDIKKGEEAIAITTSDEGEICNTYHCMPCADVIDGVFIRDQRVEDIINEEYDKVMASLLNPFDKILIDVLERMKKTAKYRNNKTDGKVGEASVKGFEKL